MIDRIQLILKSKNLSSSQFADEIQVQRSSVSHILTGRNKPSLDFVSKILSSYPELNSDWLLFGKGQMIKKQESIQKNSKIEEKPKKIDKSPILQKNEEIIFDGEIPENIKTGKNVGKSKNSDFSAYSSQTNKSLSKIKKIIVFYENNTFHEFTPDV